MPSTITTNRGYSKFIQIAAIVLFKARERAPNVWHTCSRVSDENEKNNFHRTQCAMHVCAVCDEGCFWTRLHANGNAVQTDNIETKLWLFIKILTLKLKPSTVGFSSLTFHFFSWKCGAFILRLANRIQCATLRCVQHTFLTYCLTTHLKLFRLFNALFTFFSSKRHNAKEVNDEVIVYTSEFRSQLFVAVHSIKKLFFRVNTSFSVKYVPVRHVIEVEQTKKEINGTVLATKSG